MCIPIWKLPRDKSLTEKASSISVVSASSILKATTSAIGRALMSLSSLSLSSGILDSMSLGKQSISNR